MSNTNVCLNTAERDITPGLTKFFFIQQQIHLTSLYVKDINSEKFRLFSFYAFTRRFAKLAAPCTVFRKIWGWKKAGVHK